MRRPHPLRRIKNWLDRDRFDAVQPLSVRVAKFLIGLSKYVTANWMTLIGLVLCLPGGFFFLNDQPIFGAVCYALSCLTDFFDGAIAGHQEQVHRKNQGLSPLTREDEIQLTLWQRINFRGRTHLGKILDPVVDKVRIWIFLFTAAVDVVDERIIWSMVGLSVLLTLARPVKRYFRVEDRGANVSGKVKVWAEVVAMAAWFFLMPWKQASFYPTIVNGLFLLCVCLAAISLYTHGLIGYSDYRKRIRKERAAHALLQESPPS